MTNTTQFASVAIMGQPNAGKSTLINAIVGEKIAPVHRKPQMTRKNLLGIYSKDKVQLVFMDTPGFHQNRQPLGGAMRSEIDLAVRECDHILVLLDVTEPWEDEFKKQLDALLQIKTVWFVLNKIDLVKKNWVVNEKTIAALYPENPFYFVSAKTGAGVADLVQSLCAQAPEGPFCYDAGLFTGTSTRQIVIDLIREKMMECLGRELPYHAAVVIEEYKEQERKDRIKAMIVVNRESQKPIVIGRRGDMIRRIRETAERDLEKLLDKRVVLNLFVKVDEDWVRDEIRVKEYF